MSTILLGKYFGIIFIILAIGILIHRNHITEVIDDILAHPALQFIAGLIPIILGTWIILVHNMWAYDWSVVVTIVGWLMLLGGIFRLWFFSVWLNLMKKHKASAPLWGGIIMLVIGVLLVYAGIR